MVGRPRVVTTAAQKAALRELARSDRRDEADRARAILLSVEGWTSARLAEVFGVTADSIRHWRCRFAEGGVAALCARSPAGPSAARGEWALAVAEEVLDQPVADRPNWTLPRLQADIERRTDVAISTSRLSEVLRKKGGSDGGGRDTR